MRSIDICNLISYTLGVIKSFRDKGLEDFFYDGSKRGIQADHVKKLRLILDRLHSAMRINDMNYPGSKLHSLQGTLKGHWAVTVSGNWRVTFQFKNGDAFVVDYQDYH